MTENPADGELIFASGVPVGSISDVKESPVAQEYLTNVAQWSIDVANGDG